jgi:hypothetical protein
MLNRKTNDIIFYGALIGIVIGVFLIRLVVVGGQASRIESLTEENNQLQDEIDELSLLVQENRDVQTDQLYELYYRIPNTYSEQQLRLRTISILEKIGITDSTETFNRNVTIRPDVTVLSSNELATSLIGYDIIQVDVTFLADSSDYVFDLIDELITNEQLFLINTVNYSNNTDGVSVQMSVSFYAVYSLPSNYFVDVNDIEE